MEYGPGSRGARIKTSTPTAMAKPKAGICWKLVMVNLAVIILLVILAVNAYFEYSGYSFGF